MLEHTTMREDELLYSTKNILFLSLEKQVCIALDTTLPESVIEGIIKLFHRKIQDEMAHHQTELQQSPWVTIYKEAQGKYLDGIHSILQNLPVTTPLIKKIFEDTDRGISYTHIPANQIVNHFLALGYDCHFYRAGFDED